MIEEDCILINVSVDRSEVAQRPRKLPTEDMKDNSRQTDDTYAEWEETQAGDTQSEVENVTNALREYTVYPLVRHVGRGHNIKYIVRW